jgi:hypothetical protein
MTERRKKPTARAKKATPVRDTGRRASKATGRANPPSKVTRPEQSFLKSVERLNQVLSKSIELAEAALTLGVRLVDGLGRGGNEYPRNRMGPADSEAAGSSGGPGPGQEGPSPAAASAPNINRVTNRSPLHPGSKVRVSFSINNESADKRSIQLTLSPLVGEMRGVRLADRAVAVSPAKIELEPLDFEKFSLVGRIPPDTAPDIYTGGIVVNGGDQPIAIPLRLVVT